MPLFRAQARGKNDYHRLLAVNTLQREQNEQVRRYRRHLSQDQADGD